MVALLVISVFPSTQRKSQIVVALQALNKSAKTNPYLGQYIGRTSLF